MLKISDSNFIKSIVDIKDRPSPSFPEFAFSGRSNVGKSSLINCLVNRKKFAKVSKHPGKTRTINYFSINNKIYLVDLPGYGFARVPLTEKEKWRIMIENYLLKNDNLKIIYFLIDIVVGPQKNDLQLVEWLQFNKLPFQIIATKADKISFNRRQEQEQNIKQILNIKNENEIILFSSKNKLGRSELLGNIEKISIGF